MNEATPSQFLANTLEEGAADILEQWIKEQSKDGVKRADVLDEAEIRDRSRRFIEILIDAIRRTDAGERFDLTDEAWTPAKTFLRAEADKRDDAGIAPVEAAGYVLSMKGPLLTRIQSGEANNGLDTVAMVLAASRVIDQLALFTTDIFLERRDSIIQRQQREMTELSTPVIQIWDRIVILPLIGTLDSERAQMVMENLLEAIVDMEAEFAILDITGVPTVDTLVAQNLIKTAAAARLMGAQCIICGIKPKIAQIIVQLGIDLPDVITRGDLQGALVYAFDKAGLKLVPKES